MESYKPDPIVPRHEDPEVRAMVAEWDTISLDYPLIMVLVRFTEFIEKRLSQTNLDTETRINVEDVLTSSEELEAFISEIRPIWEVPWKMDVVRALMA